MQRARQQPRGQRTSAVRGWKLETDRSRLTREIGMRFVPLAQARRPALPPGFDDLPLPAPMVEASRAGFEIRSELVDAGCTVARTAHTLRGEPALRWPPFGQPPDNPPSGRRLSRCGPACTPWTVVSVPQPDIPCNRGAAPMILRRLVSLVALGALLLSSGCCWHERHCCHRPILFPRIRGAYCEHGCCESSCSTCCHSAEFAGPPAIMTPEPAMAPLPMPRPVPMRTAN
jgi:hypothetical protein